MSQEIKFYGQWKPEVDRSLYETYFKDKQNGFFIEAGALDGIAHSNCKVFEEFFNWKGINVEPVPNFYNSLVINRPNAININAILSDTEGTGIIQEMPQAKGLSHVVSEKINANCHEVKKITYNKLIEDYNVTEVDLLSLDVEGFEIPILKSLYNAVVLPHVICVEWKQVGMEVIKEVLAPFGYKFDKQFHNNITMVR